MPNVHRITQVVQEVDLQVDTTNRRVTQVLLEVDICNLSDMSRLITQAILEVDLWEAVPPSRLLAAPAIDSAVMIH